MGVVGAGKIGRAFIAIMLGFGCKVMVYDAFAADNLPRGAQSAALDDVLAQADIISLHCPLAPRTYHLIVDMAVAKLKRGAMLINTSRGGLVDARAVISGLKSGQIGYLGLDVYEEEGDIFFEDLPNQVIQDGVFARLTTFSNVIITGHQAFFTHEALQPIAEVTLGNVTAFAKADEANFQRVL